MEAFEAFLAGSPSTMGDLGHLEPMLPDAKPESNPTWARLRPLPLEW